MPESANPGHFVIRGTEFFIQSTDKAGMNGVPLLVLCSAFLASSGQNNSILRGGDIPDSTRIKSASRPVEPPDYALAYALQVEEQILRFTNLERQKQHLAPLQPREMLSTVARFHSEDMLDRNFFGHVNPDSKSFWDRIAVRETSQVTLAAENIWSRSASFAAGSPEQLGAEIVRGWMNSPGHRRQILCLDFTHLGVGVAEVRTGSEVRATQVFARIAAGHPTDASR